MPGQGGRDRLVRFGIAGGSDIIGWVREQQMAVVTRLGERPTFPAFVARFLALEVKRPGEKLSPAQATFLDLVRAAGGIGERVESVEQVREILGERRMNEDPSPTPTPPPTPAIVPRGRTP